MSSGRPALPERPFQSKYCFTSSMEPKDENSNLSVCRDAEKKLNNAPLLSSCDDDNQESPEANSLCQRNGNVTPTNSPTQNPIASHSLDQTLNKENGNWNTENSQDDYFTCKNRTSNIRQTNHPPNNADNNNSQDRNKRRSLESKTREDVFQTARSVDYELTNAASQSPEDNTDVRPKETKKTNMSTEDIIDEASYANLSKHNTEVKKLPGTEKMNIAIVPRAATNGCNIPMTFDDNFSDHEQSCSTQQPQQQKDNFSDHGKSFSTQQPQQKRGQSTCKRVLNLSKSSVEFLNEHLSVGVYSRNWQDIAELHNWDYQQIRAFENKFKGTGNHFSELLYSEHFSDYRVEELLEDLEKIGRKDLFADFGYTWAQA